MAKRRKQAFNHGRYLTRCSAMKLSVLITIRLLQAFEFKGCNAISRRSIQGPKSARMQIYHALFGEEIKVVGHDEGDHAVK